MLRLEEGRMGHIDLAPKPQFRTFGSLKKVYPGRMGLLLDMSPRTLEKSYILASYVGESLIQVRIQT